MRVQLPAEVTANLNPQTTNPATPTQSYVSGASLLGNSGLSMGAQNNKASGAANPLEVNRNKNTNLQIIGRGVAQLLPSIGVGATSAIDSVVDSVSDIDFRYKSALAKQSKNTDDIVSAHLAREKYNKANDTHILGNGVKSWEQAVEEKNASIVADNPDSGLAEKVYAGTQLARSAGEMLPSIAASALVGGLGVAASGGKEAIALAGTSAAKKAALESARGLGAKVGLGVMAMDVYDKSLDESTKQGYDFAQSSKKAFLDASLEVGTEMLFGGIAFLGEGVVSKVSKNIVNRSIAKAAASEGAEQLIKMTGVEKAVLSVAKAANRIGEIAASNTFTRLASNAFGEAAEEMISEFFGPYIERMTTNPNADNATVGQMIEAGIGGALISFAMAPLGKLETMIGTPDADYVEKARLVYKLQDADMNLTLARNLAFDSIADEDVPVIEQLLGRTVEPGTNFIRGLAARDYEAIYQDRLSKALTEAEQSGKTPEAMSRMWREFAEVFDQVSIDRADEVAAEIHNSTTVAQAAENSKAVLSAREAVNAAKEKLAKAREAADKAVAGKKNKSTGYAKAVANAKQELSRAQAALQEAEAGAKKSVELRLSRSDAIKRFGKEAVDNFSAAQRVREIKAGRFYAADENGAERIYTRDQYASEKFGGKRYSQLTAKQKAVVDKAQADYQAKIKADLDAYAAKINEAIKSRGLGDKLRVEISDGHKFAVGYNKGIIHFSTSRVHTTQAADYYLAHEFTHAVEDQLFTTAEQKADFRKVLNGAMQTIGFDHDRWYARLEARYKNDYAPAIRVEAKRKGVKDVEGYVEKELYERIESEVYARFMQTAFGSESILQSLAVFSPDLVEQMRNSIDGSSVAELTDSLWDYERMRILERIDRAIAAPTDAETNKEKNAEAVEQAFKDIDEDAGNLYEELATDPVLNRDALQRMVDDAAEAAGYTVKAYHGTKSEFTVFDKEKSGGNYSGWSMLGRGFYFTPNASEAQSWGDQSFGNGDTKVLSVYLNPGNTIKLNASMRGNAYAESLFSNESEQVKNFALNTARGFVSALRNVKGYNEAQIQSALMACGYDAIDNTWTLENGEKGGEYVVFDPSQVKSADPVTYDDNGNVIPLSKRFDTQNDDIRYFKDVDEASGNLYNADENSVGGNEDGRRKGYGRVVGADNREAFGGPDLERLSGDAGQRGPRRYDEEGNIGSVVRAARDGDARGERQTSPVSERYGEPHDPDEDYFYGEGQFSPSVETEDRDFGEGDVYRVVRNQEDYPNSIKRVLPDYEEVSRFYEKKRGKPLGLFLSMDQTYTTADDGSVMRSGGFFSPWRTPSAIVVLPVMNYMLPNGGEHIILTARHELTHAIVSASNDFFGFFKDELLNNSGFGVRELTEKMAIWDEYHAKDYGDEIDRMDRMLDELFAQTMSGETVVEIAKYGNDYEKLIAFRRAFIPKFTKYANNLGLNIDFNSWENIDDVFVNADRFDRENDDPLFFRSVDSDAEFSEEQLRQYEELKRKYGKDDFGTPNKINDHSATSRFASRLIGNKANIWDVDENGQKTMTGVRTPEELQEAMKRELLNGVYAHIEWTDAAAMTAAKSRMLYHEEYTKKGNAKKTVQHKTLADSYSYARGMLESGRALNKNDIAFAQQLIVDMTDRYNQIEAGKNPVQGESTDTTELFNQLQEMIALTCAAGTRAGQNLQAFSLLKKMTPQGRLFYIEQQSNQLLTELVDRRGESRVSGYRYQKDDLGRYKTDASGHPIPITISSELRTKMLNCTAREEIDAVEKEIISDIASQIGPTITDRVVAWRYLAMLCNPRTHIRNIVSNGAMGVSVQLKNAIGGVLEDQILSGKTTGRTKTAKQIDPATRKALLDFADNDWTQDNVNEIALSGGKVGFQNRINEERRKLGTEKFHPLDTVSKGNTWALEKADDVAAKYAYKRAFAGYAAANGLSVEYLGAGTVESNTALAQARSYAIKEAAKATYHDASDVATMLNELEKKSGLAGKIIVGGLVPFKKTPVNILKRGVEYSPIGLLSGITKTIRTLNTVTEDIYEVDGKKVTKSVYESEYGGKGGRFVKPADYGAAYTATTSADALDTKTANQRYSAEAQKTKAVADAIDQMAAGLTGTGLMILGLLLAKIGMMSGAGSDNDDEKYYDEMTGTQEYSITIGNTNYTLDWLTPVSMPMFAGVALWEMFSPDEEVDFPDLLTAVSKLADPVMNLSVLQGVNDAISSYDSGLGKAVLSSAESFAGQFIPTLSGQLARSVDPTRRTTYAPKDSNNLFGKEGATFLNRMKNKIPGLSQKNAAYVDQWGRTEEDDSGFIGRLFANSVNPSYTRQTNKTQADDYISMLLAQTGDRTVIPKSPDANYVFGDDKFYLTSDEYQTTKQLVGQISNVGVTSLLSVPGFAQLSADEQADLVSDIYSFARKVAKADYAVANGLSYTEESSVVRIKNAVAAGMSIGAAMYVNYVANSMTADKDANGKSISGSKKAKVLNLYTMMGLTPQQIDAISIYDTN